MFSLAIDELCFLNFLCKWNHIKNGLGHFGTGIFYLDFPVVVPVTDFLPSTVRLCPLCGKHHLLIYWLANGICAV